MTQNKQHVPLRSCVFCGKKTKKMELLRIVATKSAVEVDRTGKLPGRGAYVCTEGDCIRESLGSGRIDSALRRKLSAEEWAGVRFEIEQSGSSA